MTSLINPQRSAASYNGAMCAMQVHQCDVQCGCDQHSGVSLGDSLHSNAARQCVWRHLLRCSPSYTLAMQQCTFFSSTTSVPDINTPMQLFRTAHPGFWNWHVPLSPEPITLPNSQSILGLHFHFLPSALFRMLPCCKLKNKSASLHSKRLILGCYFTPKTRLNTEEFSCMSPLSHDLHHQGT